MQQRGSPSARIAKIVGAVAGVLVVTSIVAMMAWQGWTSERDIFLVVGIFMLAAGAFLVVAFRERGRRPASYSNLRPEQIDEGRRLVRYMRLVGWVAALFGVGLILDMTTVNAVGVSLGALMMIGGVVFLIVPQRIAARWRDFKFDDTNRHFVTNLRTCGGILVLGGWSVIAVGRVVHG